MKITKEQGITLIALVITIIVLLILAGVALDTLTGNTSIIDNANNAVARYNASANEDKNVLNQVEDLFSKYMGESNEEVQEEPIDYQELYRNIGLVDYWKLQGSLDNEVENKDALQVNKGTPTINDTETYLNGAKLSTISNYTLNNNFTMMIQVKDAVYNKSNKWEMNFFIGLGNSSNYDVSSSSLGIYYRIESGYYNATTGAGGNYNPALCPVELDLNEWHTYAITWNGNDFIFYLDGQYLGKSNQCTYPSNSKLYVGGLSDNDVETKANYKNVLIFNRALSDYEIENFETIISSNNGIVGNGNIPIYSEDQLKKAGSTETVYVSEAKKIYDFGLGKTYILQNDIKFYGDYTNIQTLINNGQITLNKNGYNIEVIDYEYVKNGLVLWYDGIENSKYGRNNNSYIWKDLSGNNDGKLHNFNNTSSSGWNDNYLVFDGVNDWVGIGQMNYSNITIEVVMEWTNDNFGANEKEVIVNWESGGYGIAHGSNSENIGKNGFCVNIDGKGYKWVTSTNNFTKNNKYRLSGSYDGNTIKLWENNNKYTNSITGTIKTTTKSTQMMLGANPNGSSAEGNYAPVKIYSVRVYNRALTDAEVAQNYEVDKARFEIE